MSFHWLVVLTTKSHSLTIQLHKLSYINLQWSDCVWYRRGKKIKFKKITRKQLLLLSQFNEISSYNINNNNNKNINKSKHHLLPGTCLWVLYDGSHKKKWKISFNFYLKVSSVLSLFCHVFVADYQSYVVVYIKKGVPRATLRKVNREIWHRCVSGRIVFVKRKKTQPILTYFRI